MFPETCGSYNYEIALYFFNDIELTKDHFPPQFCCVLQHSASPLYVPFNVLEYYVLVEKYINNNFG